MLWRTLITPLIFVVVLVLLPIAPTVAQFFPFTIIPANMLIREPRQAREKLPNPRWAAFWRWVAFAPLIAFVIVLIWLW